MGWGSLLAIPVVILGVLAFWLNVPIPPNTANPIQYKIWAARIKLDDDLAKLESWWTGEDYRIIEQRNAKAGALANRLQDPEVLVSEENFDGVHTYIYQPKNSGKNRAAMIYYHGGGFRTCHPVQYESFMFRFVKSMNMVVVAPDYRLTPNVKAPAPQEDSLTATKYFFKNAEKYGVNPKLIVAAGDSAGGNLATALPLMLRDQGSDQFICQLLIYPWLQGLDLWTPSYVQNDPSVMALMTQESMANFLGSFIGLPPKSFPDLMANKHVRPEVWDKYKEYFNLDEIPKESIPSNYKPVRPKEVNEALADFVKEDLTNPYNFPLLAENLSDLPPAFILTVENDPLRDEGIWYANRLKRAGNKVIHEHSLDGFHAMIGKQSPPVVFDSAVATTDNMITFVQEIMDDLKENAEKPKPKTPKAKPVDTKADKTVKKAVEDTPEQENVDKPKPETAKAKPVDTKADKTVKKAVENTPEQENVEKQKPEKAKAKPVGTKADKTVKKVAENTPEPVKQKEESIKSVPVDSKKSKPSKEEPKLPKTETIKPKPVTKPKKEEEIPVPPKMKDADPNDAKPTKSESSKKSHNTQTDSSKQSSKKNNK